MDETAALTLTSTGQVTFQRALLEHLGAQPGDKLVVDLLPGGRVEVRAAPRGSIRDFIGSLQYDGPPVSLEDIQESIEAGWAGET